MEQNWAMSIKNIYNIFKKELAFQSYSKMLIILLLPLLFISSGYIYVHYKNTIDSYQQFKKTEGEYKELGIDIKQALESPVKVKEGELKSKDGDGEIVENILRFDYENFVLSLHHLEPKQSVIMTLELMGFIIFPLAFTLYAIYISSYDIRFKTVKVKAVSHDWKSVLFAKQCSVYMVMAAAVIAVVCMAYVSSLVFIPWLQGSYRSASSQYPLFQKAISRFSSLSFWRSASSFRRSDFIWASSSEALLHLLCFMSFTACLSLL